jgi:hypothetical protein
MGASLPATLILGKGDNGAIFVDNDKSHDVENVLSRYVSRPKLFTLTSRVSFSKSFSRQKRKISSDFSTPVRTVRSRKRREMIEALSSTRKWVEPENLADKRAPSC